MQDPERRKALDGAREEARLREMATQAAAQQERERQWRIARGTATAEDLRGPIRVGPAQRDTWMTDLPEARRAAAAPSQVSVVSLLTALALSVSIELRSDGKGPCVTWSMISCCFTDRGKRLPDHGCTAFCDEVLVVSRHSLRDPCYACCAGERGSRGGCVMQTTFSQRGIQERGDTRAWTETPQQKLLRLSAAEQQRAPQLEAARGPDTSAAADAVDAYNSSVRAKTLVEQHQEKLKVRSCL